MSGTALLEIQNAVRTALQGDTALMSMVTGVLDHVPAGQPYPYVVLGEKTESDSSSLGRSGTTATLALDVLSQAQGDTELLEIYGRIREVLGGQPLSLTGYTLVSARTSLASTAMEPDGITRRAVARFEAVTQAA